ncbi:Predicted DNA-binding transcriptional regulator YafY, contains an HTH and WYL domains [Streptomyces zhaozhouensis]|uniref:Predicted DNA-binding transcriptional regulator YafY, contains an HTH and WYL domains n=1 Tax=Streptomyces zhaozhouensis TaxID=1300267 RepID=A0A286DZ82_9ACTN|nr:WYL domain-containing protein [Streptomyces zhaozhouensis]SOD63962.1 Predicted DNA-binding transcriptional regulator YafY, contains an HTH and WYL domains [Streptomyces zhaozhouensis]
MGDVRADRLLSLILLLQNRGRLTAPELAAELEVSVRTVYRDVEALAGSGVPVVADRGPAGGFRLLEGYRTRLTGLTDGQAESLFLAGVPGAARELGLGAELAAAQLKLRAALPAELAERAERVAERFHLDAPGWFRESEPVPQLATLARAVWEQLPARAHYRGWRREGERELWPLGLVLKGGIWYLMALRRRPGEEERQVRGYRVARFTGVRLGDERFERPEGFELAAHWEEFTRRLAAHRFHGVARLRISPRAARLLPMFFGAAGVEAVAAAGPEDGLGWRVVELPVESRAIAVGDLLRLGEDAEVLGPPELRAAVAEAVHGLARRYARETADG